jgi:hypothetical protein
MKVAEAAALGWRVVVLIAGSSGGVPESTIRSIARGSQALVAIMALLTSDQSDHILI